MVICEYFLLATTQFLCSFQGDLRHQAMLLEPLWKQTAHPSITSFVWSHSPRQFPPHEESRIVDIIL